MSNLFNEVFAVSGTRKQPSVGVMDVTVNGRKGEGTMKKNEVSIFKNTKTGIQVRVLENSDGSISINAEDVAIGFGWCRTEMKNGREYRSVMWARINGYCKELGFAHECAKDTYIPEPLFYRLGMKANNAAAEEFQNWLAFDVIPDIRKNGSYSIFHKTASHNIQIPSSVNTAAKIIKDTYADAGVDPKFIAVAVGNLYKESTGYDAGIPLISEDAQLYDKTSIAEKFGICSKSGKPHPQAVGAIISQLEVAEDECVNTPYNRHGHSGVDVQYKESVCDKVEGWLELHAYPDEIMSESGKKLKVNYRGDV